MNRIEVKIDGATYVGWQKVNINRSIEALSGRFEIELTDRQPFPIPRGGAVEVLLYGETIITGYTDRISPGFSADEHTLTITGRDKTGDLVDAAALVDSQELLNVTLRDIIEEVISPYGITAIFDIDPAEEFKKFSFQEETAFEAIERACRLRGVFASSNEKGEVVIQEYGSRRASTGLEQGGNILSARGVYEDKNRFSEYRVFGQQPGGDNIDAEAAASPQGLARDQGVSRYRPKIIIAEGAVDEALAQDRAEWEAAVRAARASSIECQVQGWLSTENELWRENALVRINAPRLRANGDMLVKEVSFALDDKNGEKTNLILVRPDAYLKQPDLEKEEIGQEDE